MEISLFLLLLPAWLWCGVIGYSMSCAVIARGCPYIVTKLLMREGGVKYIWIPFVLIVGGVLTIRAAFVKGWTEKDGMWL